MVTVSSPPDSLVVAGDGLGGLRVPDPSRSAEPGLDRTPPELPTTFSLLQRTSALVMLQGLSQTYVQAYE